MDGSYFTARLDCQFFRHHSRGHVSLKGSLQGSHMFKTAILFLITLSLNALATDLPKISVGFGDQFLDVIKRPSYRFKTNGKYLFTETLTVTEPVHFIFQDQFGDLDLAQTKFLVMRFEGGQLHEVRVSLTPEYTDPEMIKKKRLELDEALKIRGWQREAKPQSFDEWTETEGPKFIEIWRRGEQTVTVKITRRSEKQKLFMLDYEFYDYGLIGQITRIKNNLHIDDHDEYKPLPFADQLFPRIQTILKNSVVNGMLVLDLPRLYIHPMPEPHWQPYGLPSSKSTFYWVTKTRTFRTKENKVHKEHKAQLKEVSFMDVTIQETLGKLTGYPKKDCGVKESWIFDSTFLAFLHERAQNDTRENGIGLPPGFVRDENQTVRGELKSIAKVELRKHNLGEHLDDLVARAVDLSAKFKRGEEELWIVVVEPDVKEYFFVYYRKSPKVEKSLVGRYDFVTACDAQ